MSESNTNPAHSRAMRFAEANGYEVDDSAAAALASIANAFVAGVLQVSGDRRSPLTDSPIIGLASVRGSLVELGVDPRPEQRQTAPVPAQPAGLPLRDVFCTAEEPPRR